MRLALGVEEDVAGLDIAVDEPVLMCVVQRVGDRCNNLCCLELVQPITADAIS